MDSSIGENSNNDETQKIPHALVSHTFKSPTFCDFCGELLYGLVRQGLKCDGCGLSFHKRCVYKIANNCTQTRRRPSSKFLQTRRHSDQVGLLTASQASVENMRTFQVPSLNRNRNSSLPHVRSVDADEVSHRFVIRTYTRPTVCSYCKKLLKGLIRQGMQCQDCKLNIHKRKCIECIPMNCPGEVLKDNFESKNDAVEDSENIYHIDEETGGAGNNSGWKISIPPDLEDDESKVYGKYSEMPLQRISNIPVQRIVQSTKYTKKKNSKVLKEGWLVHHTNKENRKKRHFWRLNDKSVTLFQDETILEHYKEIPLSEILSCEILKYNISPGQNESCCLEIRTADVDYYITEEINNLNAWNTAIRQALSPIDDCKRLSEDSNEEPWYEALVTGKSLDFSLQYQIFRDEVLGSGHFGVVYEGVHRTSGRSVAVKVIDKQRFPNIREAQHEKDVSVLQNVHHPGIVNREKMFETAERILLVTEKLQRDMLEMILSSEKGRLSERIAKFLIYQILIGLQHLHLNNIVHCDLKPENVLLSSDSDFPQVKLCDFGYSRIIGEDSFRRSVLSVPAYLAPEFLTNEGYDKSLDMWSVGIIIYVSLSGTFPFTEEEEVIDQIQKAGFLYPLNPWKEISSDAIDLINSLLQVKRSERFTVNKSLSHSWMQDYQTWCDLRRLETNVGTRYLTHPSDDTRWEEYRKLHNLEPPFPVLLEEAVNLMSFD